MSLLKTLFSFLLIIQRAVVSVLFWLLVLVSIIVIGMMNRAPKIPDQAVLYLNLEGTLTETLPNDSGSMLLSALGADDMEEKQIRTRDVMEVLQQASSDKRIKGVILEIGSLEKVGMSTIKDVSDSLDAFRAVSHKPVWVWSDSYTQGQYLIAAHADRVSVHPMGQILLKGLSSTSLYWGDTLRLFGIGVDVHKAGSYKSAPEVLSRNAPSQENIEAQKSYLNAAWLNLTSDLEQRRGLLPGSVTQWINRLPDTMNQAHTMGEMFLEAGLVDRLETRESYWKAVAESFSPTKNEKDLPLVRWTTYLALTHSEPVLTSDGVYVLSAEGEITAEAMRGGIIPSDVAQALDSIREDSHVKALVLRLNTPGGDAMAAESIRANLADIAKHIPVVISMGDMAASGGYWISTAAQKIVASPLTLTGSIGVFALSFNAEALKQRFSVGQGGYQTTVLADMGNPIVAPNAAVEKLMTLSVNRTYLDFKKLVSESRQLSMNAVEDVAQGRVWMGSQAVQKGLVDTLGNLNDAVTIAKHLANLPDEAPVAYNDVSSQDWRSRFRRLFGRMWGRVLGPLPVESSPFTIETFVTGQPLVWLPLESKLQ